MREIDREREREREKWTKEREGDEKLLKKVKVDY